MLRAGIDQVKVDAVLTNLGMGSSKGNTCSGGSQKPQSAEDPKIRFEGTERIDLLERRVSMMEAQIEGVIEVIGNYLPTVVERLKRPDSLDTGD